MPPLMSALADDGDLELVPGIAFIREGEFVTTGPPRLPRLARKRETGWPTLDIFPVEQYITTPKPFPFAQSDRIFTLVTGRGCPYTCNFCYSANNYRKRDNDDILDEMEYMVDRYNLNSLYFSDDLVMLSKRKVTELCEGMLDRHIDIHFSISARVDNMDREVIKLLKEAGCVLIFVGIESGSQVILDSIGKQSTVEANREAVHLIREAGIDCQYGLMFGQPTDTEATLRENVEFIKDITFGLCRTQLLFGCIPFPGSHLYDWCKETGRIRDDEHFYDLYTCQDMHLNQYPVNMTDLPDEHVQRIFQEANQELLEYFRAHGPGGWKNTFSTNQYKRSIAPGVGGDFSEISGLLSAL